MSLYRGAGGASDATDDSTVNAVAGYASSAASSASAAAASATTATNNATAAATSASQAASSTSSAATSASNAATSASNAASSASSASSSASSASTSATNASNSAGNASTYASEALGYRNTASTHATNAASSASAAAGSATSAANSAASALAIYGNTAAMEAAVDDAQEAALTAQQESQAASDSAIAAAESEDLAFEYSQNAAESATTAQSAANSALAASTSANAAWDQFDDRYLGAKAADPTTDNDGNLLVAGALYFNTSTSSMKVYTGSVWTDAYTTGNGFLVANNNLSDLQSAATARTNLGLGTAALENSTALVHTTGDETIAGTKTFTSTITGSVSGNAGTVTNGVYTTGDQTIGGTKTFSSTITGSISGNAGTVTNGVYTTGDQTIGGTKTFSSTISGSITGNAGTVTNGVYTTGDQTIAGTKTFSSNPVLSAGTANGVAYLNGSKVLTTGSALTFDGSALRIKAATDQNLAIGSGSGVIGLFALNDAVTSPVPLQFQGEYLRFNVGAPSASEQMRLTSTGLGIGTSSPAQKLDVNGKIRTNSWMELAGGVSSYATTGDYPIIYSWADGSINGDLILQSRSTSVTGIRFVTGATPALSMYLNASGNLGLGVTPSAWSGYGGVIELKGIGFVGSATTNMQLGANFYYNGTNSIYKTTAAASLYQQNSGQHQWYNAASGTAGQTITFTQAMTLDASGRLGVGSTETGYGFVNINRYSSAPLATLTLGDFATASNSVGIYIRSSSTAGISWASGGALTFNGGGPGNDERARIDSSGNLLVGTTSSSATSGSGIKLIPSATAPYANVVGSDSTNGTYGYYLYSTGASAFRFYVGYGGTIYATSTTITAISDQRLKENVRDLDDGLDAIMALKPRKFDWKAGKGKDIKDDRGFIAQEFEQVFPDMVEEWRDPAPEGEEPYKAVNANLIPTLVKAIQELKASLDEVKLEFDAYKATHP